MKRIMLILLMAGLTNSTFAQTDSINCRIWKPTSFCNMPDSVVYFKQIKCTSCTWDLYPCDKLNTDKLTGVWLTLNGNWTTLTLNKDSAFSLENNFKNIVLTKKNGGKIIHPYAILLDGYPEYMKSKFKTKEYFVTFDPKKRFDLFIIFTDAEKGDKLRIEGFIDTEIK